MSDILIAIPSELVQYNHDEKKNGKGKGTITLNNLKIPVSWTYGIDNTKFIDFANRHIVGYFREPPTFKVIEKIEVKLKLK